MKKHLLIALGAIALTFPLSCTSDYMNQEDDLFDQSGTDSNSNDADDPADDGSPQTDDPSSDPATDPGTDSSDTPVIDPFAGLVTYLGDVQPILNQLCVSCHNASVHRDGVDISTYELSRLNIDEILESMTEDEDDIMPPSGRVDNSILQTLAAWKADGLLEGQAPAEDPTPLPPDGTLTYTANILTLFQNNCNMCHGANSPAGGFNMSTYQLAVAQIDLIMARMELQTGQAGVMPPAGPLSATQLQMIRDWIDQGMPE